MDEELKNELEEVIENVWENYYTMKGIDTGDIYPEQLIRFDSIVEQLTNLIVECGRQNIGM